MTFHFHRQIIKNTKVYAFSNIFIFILSADTEQMSKL